LLIISEVGSMAHIC